MNDDEEIITFKTKRRLGERISAFFSNPKKRLWFIIISGLVLISAVGAGLYFMNRPEQAPAPSKPTSNKEKSAPETKYYGLLDGLETDQVSSVKHPLGIMVENHIAARPQAGLDKASIIYEAIAEGGITRFLALFGTHEADKVGPVRSARTYYVDWALGYNAWFSHVGGNFDALDQIKADKVLDLDQFRYPSSYWREAKLGVSSEHTMFTSTIKLREQANKLNYSSANNFRAYKFKEIASPASNQSTTGPTAPSAPATSAIANKVNVNFSSANYNVVFQYDAVNNRYKRMLSGKVQTDRTDGAEIAPTNLIVMTVKRSPTVTKINEPGWNMSTIGEGVAKIFIGGHETNARWVKNSKTEREVFYDSNNAEITFDRGQFWICVIPPDSSVTFE